MIKILVVGASKGIGLEVTKQALASGYAVRALARSAGAMPLAHDRLEKVNGSALNAADVLAALDGVSAVLLTLGVAARPEMLIGPVRLFSQATGVVVPAMEQVGVRRLVCVTGFGAGDSRASMSLLESIPFRLLLGRVYDDKDVQEEIIRKSNLDWIISRPGILTNGPKTSKYKVLDKRGSWHNGIISRADVADFLVKQIEETRYLRTTPALVS